MKDEFVYTKGVNPDMDAWVKNFFTENHLAYETYPDMVASPEQLNFMVHLEQDHLYYPCTDALFRAIIEKRADTLLTSAYTKLWSQLEALVNDVIVDEYKKKYLLSLLSTKYANETSSKVHLPTRLAKRLLGIFTNLSEIDRPLASAREKRNKRVADFLGSALFQEIFESVEGVDFTKSRSLTDISVQMNLLKFKRLLLLSTIQSIREDDTPPSKEILHTVMNQSLESGEWLWICEKLSNVIHGRNKKPCILWLAGRSGEFVFDLAMIRILMGIGVRVILSVKQNFYYHYVSFEDIIEDPTLISLLDDADIVGDQAISKNELLRLLDNDKRLLVIADGTREPFNPLLTSVTFARAFKEADLVISRGPDCRETITNSFQFTRDIISVFRTDDGKLDMLVKPHHPGTIRFPQSVLRKKAEALIDVVKKEKAQGKKILFYSAIVGSIPGQLHTAKTILNVFVEHLRTALHEVVIINPAEHFEEGMDADDIMYMWEIFQRSGMIDIWRFQTMDDIEYAFELMGKKVPPEWSGKDATYSTGCTKEMDIAIEMQQQYSEMQLIGPPIEKFKRRREYGVGKLYDRTLIG